MTRTADRKPSYGGPSLEELQRRARAEWEKVWSAQTAPAERFEITFKADWKSCGEAMAAICSFGVSEVTWTHDPPRHAVTFTCTFETLKSVQAAVKGTPVLDLRCHRRG